MRRRRLGRGGEGRRVKGNPSFFQRFLLPAFSFKAVVIGGGYATGRELVEFFFGSGPRGGLLGLIVTTLIWSLVCVATFLFAVETRSFNYKTFFQNLLGPFWLLFEAAYLALILLVLSVFAASAGEIGRSLIGWPPIVGTLLLMAGISAVLSYGNSAVEALFKYVTIFLYAIYAIFFILSMFEFGERTLSSLAAPVTNGGWLIGGISYAGYNLVGAVVILPMLRHLTGRRDAVVAGLLCGPLAAVPAFLFFLCLIAFYPQSGEATIPSDFLLAQLHLPAYRFLFQLMVLTALLESGAGLVHAINERVSSAYPARSPAGSMTLRLLVALAVMVSAAFIAQAIGLIDLIARGYTASAYVFLAVFVLPLLVVTMGRLLARSQKRAGGGEMPDLPRRADGATFE
jgi:uncharacterized membrane protein YkvI